MRWLDKLDVCSHDSDLDRDQLVFVLIVDCDESSDDDRTAGSFVLLEIELS